MLLLIGLLLGGRPASSDAQQRGSSSLDEKQWQLLDSTIDRALKYLAIKQGSDGSFEAPPVGQPGITSLCVLAYLSRGIRTDDPVYGPRIRQGIHYVIKTQKPDGLFSHLPRERWFRSEGPSHAALYNHAMAGYFLCEVYGMMESEDNQRIGAGVDKGLLLSRDYQVHHKRRQIDRGGWKYLRKSPTASHDSDVLVTTWQLKFLRAAQNAGFVVPQSHVDEAIAFVERCYNKEKKRFEYCIDDPKGTTNRSASGAGIFALSLAGKHKTVMAREAADKLLETRPRYNEANVPFEQYHYTIYHSSQAMFQLGGRYWSTYFPPLLKTLAENQQPDGSWQPTRTFERFGTPYTVALTVLALSLPYEILPIYQR